MFHGQTDTVGEQHSAFVMLNMEKHYNPQGMHLYLRQPVNTLRPSQNGHHFSDNNFKCIFLNENV